MLHLVIASSQPSLTTLLPRLFLSMAVVIALMWVAARFMKGRQIPGSGIKFGSAPKRALLQVLARQGVGRHASITIVRAGDKTLVLGITDQNVSLLTELDEVDLDQVTEASLQQFTEPQGTGASLTVNTVGSARTGLLTQIRDLTVRKTN